MGCWCCQNHLSQENAVSREKLSSFSTEGNYHCWILIGVHEPGNIRAQMDFSKFVMLKMFLSACSAGMLSMSVMCMISGSMRRVFQAARLEFDSCIIEKGLATAVIGGGLLGAGMTIAGACPGMVLAQVGSMTHHSLYTLAGGFLGVFTYALLEPTITPLVRPSGVGQHKKLGGDYLSTALPLGAMLAIAVAGLEYYHPWTQDVSSSWGGNFFERRAWPPYISGALIGLLQVPLIMVAGSTLGSATSYCTIASQTLITPSLKKIFSYLTKFRSGFSNWWQVWYICGCIAGAYLSSSASGSLNMGSGVTKYEALTGGALMLFGSRLAGGCTSGHGLSGMGMLVINSMITVASMFAGGILTKQFFH